MFPARYWHVRYWAGRFWPKVGAEAPPPPPPSSQVFAVLTIGRFHARSATPAVGDIGVTFTAVIKDAAGVVDVTSASDRVLVFQRPNGTTVEKPASVVDGPAGKIAWASDAGFFDQGGLWKWCARVAFDTAVFTSTMTTFEVREALSV